MVEEKRAARAESHQPVVEAKHAEITQAIIGAFYAVYNELGYGFAEKVYENALALELAKSGHSIQHQAPLRVHYTIPDRWSASSLLTCSSMVPSSSNSRP